MSTYPERRPYATTVNHSGYLSKPRPLAPRPPTEALKMLTSHVGYDAPNTDNSRPRTTGGRLSALPSGGPSSNQPLDQSLFPDRDRTPTEALRDAKLQDPFQYSTQSYHSSQQAALNAELRHKVEKFMSEWNRKLQQLRTLADTYPPECVATNYSTTEALKAYLDVYRCTENLAVSPERLIEEHKLGTSMEEMEEIESTPVVPLDNIRRSLDSLLSSNYLLAPLDQYASSLQVFDYLTRNELAAQRVTPAETDEDGSPIGPICPSTTAVALHERFHYNPGEYSEKELKKSEDPLLDMEERLHTARRRKEDAIDEGNPGEALRNLHAQVDFSNDLLLMNKARMVLVAMHSDDAREMRADVLRVIEDAKQVADALQERVSAIIPKVTRDIGKLSEDADKAREHLAELDEKERQAEAEMRESMRASDGKERALWTQMQEIMSQLLASADQKAKAAQQRMSQREQRAKEYLTVQELLKAQETQMARLGECEEVLHRWEQSGEVYQRYVDAFVPKLLKRLEQLEDEDEDLSNREAQNYVRRYEIFTYCAEEARAKRMVQADRMRLMQRSAALNRECAAETLDPADDAHGRRMAEAEKELEEVTAYVEYIISIEDDRRREVDPVLQRVIVHNMNLQQTLESNGAPQLQLEDGDNAAEQAGADSSTFEAAAAAGEAGAVVAAVNKTGSNAAMLATVAHPYVTARKIGLSHEEAYSEKHRHLTNEELAAAEEKMGGIRRSKAELAMMTDRYKNADYIKSILEIN